MITPAWSTLSGTSFWSCTCVELILWLQLGRIPMSFSLQFDPCRYGRAGGWLKKPARKQTAIWRPHKQNSQLMLKLAYCNPHHRLKKQEVDCLTKPGTNGVAIDTVPIAAVAKASSDQMIYMRSHSRLIGRVLGAECCFNENRSVKQLFCWVWKKT